MLPKAVEEANRRAEELHRQVYGNTEKPADPPQPPAPKQEEQPPAPEPQPEPKKDEPPAPQPTPTPEDESWKRKYEVLEGKYRAELPRVIAENRDLKGQVADLQKQIESMKSTPAPSKLKPEEIEEYGDKFIDVVKRAASEVVPQDVDQVRTKVQQLEAQSQRLVRDKFFEDLGRLAPQWEQLNEDQGFLSWLAGVDPLTGMSRQDLFDQASASYDSWRVANFFKSYGSENPKPVQADPDPLAEQVEPSTQRVVTPPPAKKNWTTQEITAFYAGVRSGQYGREDAARIEADIFAAQREGRIK